MVDPYQASRNVMPGNSGACINWYQPALVASESDGFYIPNRDAGKAISSFTRNDAWHPRLPNTTGIPEYTRRM